MILDIYKQCWITYINISTRPYHYIAYINRNMTSFRNEFIYPKTIRGWNNPPPLTHAHAHAHAHAHTHTHTQPSDRRLVQETTACILNFKSDVYYYMEPDKTPTIHPHLLVILQGGHTPPPLPSSFLQGRHNTSCK